MLPLMNHGDEDDVKPLLQLLKVIPLLARQREELRGPLHRITADGVFVCASRWLHGCFLPYKKSAPRGADFIGGGATRSRTGLNGFAIRCITALLSRRGTADKEGKPWLPFMNLEREKSLELSTSTLARLRSTN